MPTGQQYATNVPQTTLSAGIGAGTTNFSVASLSSWPATPFTGILDIGLSTQEPIDVLTVTGNTITSCTRGLDGAAAFAHGSGATFTHGDIGRDFREPRAHIDTGTSPDSVGHDVHAIGSGNSVVGTGTTQTLTNKTLGATIFTGNQNMGGGAWSGTGTVQETAVAVSGLTGANNGISRLVGQTLANAPTTGTFAVGDMVQDLTFGILWICISAGTPGTWSPMVDRTLVAVNAPTGANFTWNLSSLMPTSGFNHAVIEYTCRTSNAGGSGSDYFTLQLNGVSTANYWWRSAGTSQTGAGTPSVFTDGNTGTAMNAGLTWASHFATTGSGRGVIEINDYKETNFFKQVNWRASSGDGSNASLTLNGGGLLNSTTAAITSLTISTTSGNFLTGSTFKLYAVS